MNRNLSRRPRAFTLVELAISASIMSLMIGVVMSLFIFVARAERTNVVRIRMAYRAADMHRDLRQFAAVGGVNNTVVDPDNVSVEFTDSDTGTRSRLEFVAGDGNEETIADNVIRLIPDISDPDSVINVVRFASPIDDPDNPGEFLPIFSRAGTFNQVLMVNFRVGDRRGDVTSLAERAGNDECVAEDAVTGKGFQSILFRGAYGARNRT